MKLTHEPHINQKLRTKNVDGHYEANKWRERIKEDYKNNIKKYCETIRTLEYLEPEEEHLSFEETIQHTIEDTQMREYILDKNRDTFIKDYIEYCMHYWIKGDTQGMSFIYGSWLDEYDHILHKIKDFWNFIDCYYMLNQYDTRLAIEFQSWNEFALLDDMTTFLNENIHQLELPRILRIINMLQQLHWHYHANNFQNMISNIREITLKIIHKYSDTYGIIPILCSWIIKNELQNKEGWISNSLEEMIVIDNEGFTQISSDFLASYNSCLTLPNTLKEIQTWKVIPFWDLFEKDNRLFGDNISNYNELLSILYDINGMRMIGDFFWISFIDFPLSIQSTFLTFLMNANTKEIMSIMEFLSKARNNEEKLIRIRIFLSTGRNKEVFGSIMEIEEKSRLHFWDKEWYKISQEIFKKYVGIIAIVENNAKEIRETLIWNEEEFFFSEALYIKEVLDKANNFLVDVMSLFDKENSILYTSKMEELLLKYKTNLIQYGSLFRVAEKDTKNWIENTMKKLWITMRTKKWLDLDQDDWKVVEDFYKENYSTDPRFDKIQQIVQQSKIVDTLTKDVEYTFFSYKDHPLLTIKFMKQGDGSMYFWAFNAAIQFQKYTFWGYALGEMLKKYEWKNIHAHVIEGNEHLLSYYSRFWFEVMKDEEEKPLLIEEWGVRFYHIVKKG